MHLRTHARKILTTIVLVAILLTSMLLFSHHVGATAVVHTRPSNPTIRSVCTNPVFTTSNQFGSWSPTGNPLVNNNVWGPAPGSKWSQTLHVCSKSSWNVRANFQPDQGAVQSYPDTQYLLNGTTTIGQYTSLRTCFGERGPQPLGGEWDYAYDTWLNNYGIEVMIWNDYTDTSIYPPAGSRAVTIGGVGYHVFNVGTAEWIYTRDKLVKYGCINLLPFYKDLAAHEPTSGVTTSASPNDIEYGVEIASTNGPETFNITNVTLTAQ